MTQSRATPPPPPPPMLAPASEFFWESTKWRMLAMLIWVGFVVLVFGGVLIYGAVALDDFWRVFEHTEPLGVRLFGLMLLVPPMVMIASAGGLDLSIPAVASLAGVVIALRVSNGGSPAAAFALAMGLSLLIGGLNAVLVGLLRVHGVIATLGMSALAGGIALALSRGRAIYVGREPGFLEELPRSDVMRGLIVLFAAGCAVLVHLTPMGRRPRPAAAQREDLGRRFLFVGLPYVLSALAAGLYGAQFLGWVRAAQPYAGGPVLFDVVWALALGGLCMRGRFGTVVGALLAAFVLVVLEAGLMIDGVSNWVQRIVQGAGIVVFIALSQGYYAVVQVIYASRRRSFYMGVRE